MIQPTRPLARWGLMLILTGLPFGLTATGCDSVAVNPTLSDQVVTATYEATATTIYTWEATYMPLGVRPDRPNDRGRTETFASSYRVNIDGKPVDDRGDAADAQGLWWPSLPPQPTVDELEARLQPREQFTDPQINPSVTYTLTFEDTNGEALTLKTDYAVYREAVKAKQAARSLALTLGRADAYVRAATPQ